MNTFREIVGGTVDVSVIIRIIDAVDGTPETGVVFNTAGIDIEYRRDGATSVDITEVTQTVDGAHSDGGIVHIGNGYYRVDLPDAAVAAGVTGVLVHGTVTGMIVVGTYVPITTGSTDLIYSRLGAPAGASVSADIAAVKGDTAAILDDTGTSGVALSTGTINAVADQVHDEAMSGHTASGSFGASQQPTDQGTAQAGAASSITLRSGASGLDDYYNKQLLRIVAGTGAGQSEYISDYVGGTKIATMGAAWITPPNNTSVYVIEAGGTIPGASAPTADQNAAAVWNKLLTDHVASGSFGQVFSMFVKRRGTAQAGGASTITLDAGASTTDNFYRYDSIAIVAGTGAGQGSRHITGYVQSSKVATVSLPWAVQPDATSVFMITPFGIDAATIAQIAFAVWEEARTAHTTAGTVGEYSNASIKRVNDDATAAVNLKSAFDGVTGFAFPSCSIPVVVTVSGNLAGNVGGNVTGSVGSVVGHTPQTGDAFARLGAPAGASVSADVAAVKAETAAIVADTNELQVDWVNGGRLDLLIDGVKAKTDSLTFTVAGNVDANIERINAQDIGATKPYNTAT